MNKFITTGATFGLLAVIIGAFGAHGLENRLDLNALNRYQTGVEYQFYHVGAILIIGILYNQFKDKLLTLSGICFILGILVFSGSLYAYALTGIKSFGIVTPIGGLLFIIGWGILLIFSIKNK